MDLIPEFKRDDSLDYLNILKSLNEIPFPVGKKLLVDFLRGRITAQIEKNSLEELSNFGSLSFLSDFQVEEMLDDLIAKNLVQFSRMDFNKFMQVLGITPKGQEELANPQSNSKKVSSKYEEVKTEISDNEFRAFKELYDFLKGFNDEQKKAIISNKERVLCIAGAGSGKTTVLTKRVEFLCKYEKVRKDKVMAITFTKKAKEEMQKRLAKLGVQVKVETFNSFCEKILLKNTGRIYGRRMRVASYQDKIMAFSMALSDLNLTIKDVVEKYFTEAQIKNKTLTQLQNLLMKDCFSLLEYSKLNKNLLNDSESLENGDWIKKIVKFLDNYMKMQGLRTYSDQINDALEFLRKTPSEIPQFEHVLVDEFQDVNEVQVQILNLLNPKNLFCVGDPRQAIFGWRGSNVDYILGFHKKYLNAEIINLKKNYRSVKPIVKLMNKAIAGMQMPHLEANLDGEKFLKLYGFDNEDEESEFVARKILVEKTPREDIFILARTNKQLLNLARVLKKNEIKFVLKTEENPEAEAKKDEVTLATIHSIKGLEAELVFVIGCNNLNFPCKVFENELMESLKIYEYDKEEEERRLFYVAISRAREKLYLTYYGKKHTYFINESMQKDLEFVEF